MNPKQKALQMFADAVTELNAALSAAFWEAFPSLLALWLMIFWLVVLGAFDAL